MTELPHPPELTVVVPTYNERQNVTLVVERVRAALDGVAWELLFVDDDSPDETWREVERHAAQDGRVRKLRRLQRRGLASACVEGVMASTAPYVAVMDGDAQHDPAMLPAMLALARDHDLVVASRAGTAGREAFRSGLRRWMTETGNRLGALLSRQRTSDPLSGFFLARREVFDRRAPKLYGHGFKILLDLLSADPAPLRIAEVPMALQPRAAGESKMSLRVAVDYALLLAYRLGGRLLSPRFALFCAVGLSGVAVHLAVLQATFALLLVPFAVAQAAATFVAMTTNYFLNNAITFRDRMLRGRALWGGLLSFYLACTLGAIVSVAVGELLYSMHFAVWAAGLGGAVTAAIWNFALNAEMTWRSR